MGNSREKGFLEEEETDEETELVVEIRDESTSE